MSESEDQQNGDTNGSSQLDLLFPEPLVKGQSLYLGGSYCPITDKIYCIPGHAPQVLIIDPKTDTCTPMDHPPLVGQFKYLRSIYYAETKMIYGLPCNADSILKIDPINNTVKVLPIPFETSEERTIPWKYHGGAIHPDDGCIYAIPQSATRVLKLDPMTDTISLIGPTLPGKYKWYGGVVGKTDHAIYGIPHNSSSILRIDINDQVTLHGDFTDGGHKWHGASVSPTPDGAIVCIPANADKVLLIHPSPTPVRTPSSSSDNNDPQQHLCTYQKIGSPDIIQTGRHRTDRKYKYLGAVSSPNDQKVYCLPSGSEFVLQIDAQTLEVKNVGPNIRDGPDLNCRERMRQNKWQNGFYSPKDNCCYGIPLNGETVLKIQTFDQKDGAKDPIVTTLPLPDPKGGLSKWEGGVMAKNGSMYCMPNNHKAVLKIAPESFPPAETKSTTTTATTTTTTTTYDEEKELLPTVKDLSVDDSDNTNSNERSTYNQSTNNEAKSNQQKESETNDIKFKDTKVATTTSSSSTDLEIVYTTGIPTLRSSAHRVKHNKKGKNKMKKGKQSKNAQPSQKNPNQPNSSLKILPPEIKKERIMTYDPNVIDLRAPILDMLQRVNSQIVGSWSDNGESSQQQHQHQHQQPILQRLEDFFVPPKTLSRATYGGICEEAQKYLSDFVANDESFLSTFDTFVTEHVLPTFKTELLASSAFRGIQNNKTKDSTSCSEEEDNNKDENKEDYKSESDNSSSCPSDSKIAFYYQRPPTLRLQPGPSRSSVKTHRDSEYGHQDGELNYWIPLTDPDLTNCTIWVESTPDQGDYHPMNVTHGQVAVFHGSACRHFVPMNQTIYTRMSLDFRVGVEGFFDGEWMMEGTTDDHFRRKVQV